MTEKIYLNEYDDMILERLELCVGRLREIMEEDRAEENATPVRAYGGDLAAFGLLLADTVMKAGTGELEKETVTDLKVRNAAFYADILPDEYEESFANPAYACKLLGRTRGRVASAVYSEMRAMISYAYAGIYKPVLYSLELFLEVFGLLENDADGNALKRSLFYYLHDYSGEYILDRLGEQVTERYDHLKQVIKSYRKGSPKHLYLSGEYISDNERELFKYLDKLPEEAIESMADTFVEGYIRGFQTMRVKLEGKKYVTLIGAVGFDRIHKKVIEKLEGKGLVPVMISSNRKILGRRFGRPTGLYSISPNAQYEYDHRNDVLLVLNKKLIENRVRRAEDSYRFLAENCLQYAGPMLQETFGEQSGELVNKPEVLVADERLQKLLMEQAMKLSRVANAYMPAEERSFSIIAYPIPAVGEKFEEIFHRTIVLNTLDNDTYTRIQQHLCDALNQGRFVEVRGCGKNETKLTVALYDLKNPETESIFENCTADVNIPVGEVFTSPKLTGTNGLLHVSSVYLDGKQFKNLKVWFKDGMISDYSCDNFATKEENDTFIRENVLFNHDTLPMGEFAIGTNTEAYRMGIELDCQALLPILIAEKTGPHFAVGDTCYSHAEDHVVYNPDGKEIIARDNELVRNRDKEPDKAYYQCHTDITLPYNELGELSVVTATEARIPIIVNGRFVLSGTEELNVPLDEIM